MRRVNLITPALTFTSFNYVARVTKTWMQLLNTKCLEPPVDVYITTGYMHGALNIRIDDLALTLRDAKPCDVAWLDTALLLDQVHRRVLERPAAIYTCSQWDRRKAEEKGVVVQGVIPRPFSPIAYMFRNRYKEKEFDVAIIGWHDKPDRKNFALMDEVVKRLHLKAIAVTNYKGCWQRIDFMSIDDFAKFSLLARSKYLLHLSSSEGFGMPPLEAMAVGTPVIYLDRPAVCEFAVGYGIKPSRVYKVRHRLGDMELAEVDVDYACEVVKQALDRYHTSEYEELSEQAVQTADMLLDRFLNWIRGLVK